MRFVIVDYGMGNIHSVEKALEFFGVDAEVTNKKDCIRKADRVILPGVGAFNDAIKELNRLDLVQAIAGHIKNKKPFLGICLGMQLLFEESKEGEGAEGLGILRGRVKKIEGKRNLKVPHIGWNQLKKASSLKSHTAKTCPLLKGVPENACVYFCHSYYVEPKDLFVVAATTDYGIKFTSVVWKDNIYGVQFHPEKSQDIGLRIIENFVKL